MAFKPQASFSQGESDPALWERTNLERFNTGLKTARNVWIGKTGRVISVPGRKLYLECKYAGKNAILYPVPDTAYLLELGDLYFRLHNINAGTYVETVDPALFLEADLFKLQIDFTARQSGNGTHTNASGIYISLKGVTPFIIALDGSFTQLDTTIFNYGSSGAVVATASAGDPKEYGFTYVGYNGEESAMIKIGGSYNLPVAVGQKNTATMTTSSPANTFAGPPNEWKVYRRPLGGRAYGYIGSSFTSVKVAGNTEWQATYEDIGEDADYTHTPPTVVSDPTVARPKCGIFFQDSFLMANLSTVANGDTPSGILSSRKTYYGNYTRDFPLTDDSSLLFKAGTLAVRRLLDAGNLLAFTSKGIYANEVGLLNFANSAMIKRGDWVIQDNLPPINALNLIAFMDFKSNAFLKLNYNPLARFYSTEELSIFSNHLFQNRTVIASCFRGGVVPLVYLVFSDGGMVTLTYQEDQQMKAWTRQDTQGNFKFVATALKGGVETAFFIVERGSAGRRFIEYETPRFVSDIKQFVGHDSTVSFNTRIGSGSVINITPTDPNDWSGELNLKADVACFTNAPDLGKVGTIFRFFDSQGSRVDLQVTTFTDTKNVKATPLQEFPSEQASNVIIYKTFVQLTGLDHLNGLPVAIHSDGYVIASPNNNIDNYDEYTPVGGTIILPEDARGAFIHVGLPITSDVETLDVDTVEQRPILLESKIVNQLNLKVYNSRGLYSGQNFGDGNYVTDMTDLETRTEDIELGNVGNAAQAPYTKRYEVAIDNSWESNGRVCIRQVDGLPFEILSIIPDLVSS